MDENKGLKILGETLEWSDDKARTEFRWLKMMAAIKYDDYRDFLPGMRFLENLAAWLQQFPQLGERQEAYKLLRERLIYVSIPEMQRLVELFYPSFIERRLIQIVAERRNIPKYKVRVDHNARDDLASLRRRTLILGLSDGGRIDILRHSTVGILSNEQFVIQTQTDLHKWRSLISDLRKEQPASPGCSEAAFEVIVLVDDFMGTGSSLLRQDSEDNQWKGKLPKFLTSLKDAIDQHHVVSSDWQLCIHHYLATEKASREIQKQEQDYRTTGGGDAVMKKASHYTFGATIPEADCIDPKRSSDMALVALTQKHYNPKVETRHTKVGGVQHLGLGYGGCALPLVLHHNTPNNSLALLWAETEACTDESGNPRPEMRPLFRRRQRHTA
jgi:hypothetical protein